MNNLTASGRMTCFIVPNNPINLSKSKMYDTAERIENHTNVCLLNGTDFDPEKDRIIELWYIGEEDFNTTNLCDHGGKVTIDGEDYRMGFKTRGYLPAKLFKDVKEGDTINLTIPGWVNKKENFLYPTENAQDCMFQIALTCQQLHYRYERFGRFEEVLADMGVI